MLLFHVASYGGHALGAAQFDAHCMVVLVVFCYMHENRSLQAHVSREDGVGAAAVTALCPVCWQLRPYAHAQS